MKDITNKSKSPVLSPVSSVQRVGNLIALTNKLISLTIDKWAWWNGLSEEWKSLFKSEIGYTSDTDIPEEALVRITNLTGLDLEDKSILASYPRKKGINLDYNEREILDISPLSKLTNLTWLKLSDNDVSDISK